jgi:hypothetical protein
MATGNTRNVFCGPLGEDIINILCKTARRTGVGSGIRRFQIVTKHIEVWNITVGDGTEVANPTIIESWDPTELTFGAVTTEGWGITLYTPEKVTIQTQFPNVTEPWEVTNQFFHIVGVQEEWEPTQYGVMEDSFGPIAAVTFEDWES